MTDPLFSVKQYSISNAFFEKGFAPGRGPYSCTSACCKGGVWLDVTERDAILAHQGIVRQAMDDTQEPDATHWFDSEETDDVDFPSGKAVGTNVINDKCVFLDTIGRCSIQVASVENGMHKWALKPLYCILFPIEILNNIVNFDPMLQDEEPCCSLSTVFEQPLYASCKEELTHLLGNDGYQRLDERYAELRAPRLHAESKD